MLLPPPQQPQPEDPGMENSKSLQMMKLQAFQGQNHAAHINAHQAFMSSFLVANNPPTMGILQAHISEHIAMMAREEITAKNSQVMQEQAEQFGGQVPPELMQQFQMQNETEIAEKIVELTEALVAEEQEYLGQKESDPLIDLKQQEINLRAQEIQQNKENADKKLELDTEKLNFEGQDSDPLIDLKQQELNLRAQEMQKNKENADKKLDLDVEKLNFEGKKLEQKDNMDKEKLQSQEDQADLRAEVTLAGQRGKRGS